jgi:hypothetical protein
VRSSLNVNVNAGEQHVPQDCRHIQPSAELPSMDGGAGIMRIGIDEIQNFRKEFWKQELPVIVTGVAVCKLLCKYKCCLCFPSPMKAQHWHVPVYANVF